MANSSVGSTDAGWDSGTPNFTTHNGARFDQYGTQDGSAAAYREDFARQQANPKPSASAPNSAVDPRYQRQGSGINTSTDSRFTASSSSSSSSSSNYSSSGNSGYASSGGGISASTGRKTGYNKKKLKNAKEKLEKQINSMDGLIKSIRQAIKAIETTVDSDTGHKGLWSGEKAYTRIYKSKVLLKRNTEVMDNLGVCSNAIEALYEKGKSK